LTYNLVINSTILPNEIIKSIIYTNYQ